MKNDLYIAFNAGCGIWEVERFNPSIEWHHSEYQGTKSECKRECKLQMTTKQGHYPNAEYRSIFDY